nr:hypothetical protein Iba_chr12dCG3440 [Ipomoea batatas]
MEKKFFLCEINKSQNQRKNKKKEKKPQIPNLTSANDCSTSKQFSNSSPFLITTLVAKLSASLFASKTPPRVTLELLTRLEAEKHLRASQASAGIAKSSGESPKERQN